MPDSNQVMSWAKITRRQLDNWVDKKYIVPANMSGRGFGGVQYNWSQAEATVAKKMGELTAAGIPPAIAAKVARGDRKAIERLLGALAGCVTHLRWALGPTESGPGPGAPASEAEPCH
jgi:hypothetical protein